ncbi:MAG: MFS transporter [Methylococcales bacterium]|nr:MFS transporter [Methylococcales bacterium]
MTLPYWRLSWVYGGYFAALGVLVPYWTVYLSDLGFRAEQIGELTALLVGTKLIAPTLWGIISDRYDNVLAMLRWAVALSALTFLGYFFLRGFNSYWLLTLLFGFFWNAALPQCEVATLSYLGVNRHRYSQIRLWGSVGFVIAVVIMGWVLDRVGSWHVLPAVAGLLILLGLGAGLLPRLEAQPRKTNVSMPALLSNPEVMAFFLIYLLLQFAHGPYYTFYSVFLDALGYPKAVIGALWALGVIAEIVLFVWIRPLLVYWSLRRLLVASLLLAAVRWLMIAWGSGSLAVLLIAQLLHAASFGGAHVAAIHLVDHYFGKTHPGKGQALYSSLSFGMGGILGSLFAGHGWQVLGPAWVFSTAALACLVALVLAMTSIGDHRV